MPARKLLTPVWIIVLHIMLLIGARADSLAAEPEGEWLSPSALAASPDGRNLFVACATANRVLIVDLATREIAGSISVPGCPSGLDISSNGKVLAVTCGAPEGRVCLIDVAEQRVAASLPAGHTAFSPVFSPDGKTLYICNRHDDTVSVVDVVLRKETCRIPVRREPIAAAITPDGKRLLVGNHLHNGRADAGHVAAMVSVIDTALNRVAGEFPLPSGSGFVNDVRISPDGKYAVVTHILARFHLPTTQLDRGWMNTNAKTIIDLDRMEVLNTFLLDTVDRGAANPWGAAWSADSKTLVVAIAGTHEISVTDLPAMLDKLAKLAPGSSTPPPPYSASREPADVPNDLSFLVGVRERRALPEGDFGPRGVVVVGRTAYTANYFSDTLSALELDGKYPKAQTIPLGPKPKFTPAQKGELYFHDARICFQGWQSCASCHPGDARVDGLNWDLLNDGLGNPKNNKSLLLAFQTPPAMSIGVREDAKAAVRAGIRHILFTVQPPEVADAIDVYIQSLKPVPSPHLIKGQLSPAAKRGEQLFHSKEVGCATCHPGPLFTDLEAYDVGTRNRFDRDTGTFDTPTLVEAWRTAPYLHDGSAATMRDVLTESNPNDAHGKTSHLTGQEIEDLVKYLLSL